MTGQRALLLAAAVSVFVRPASGHFVERTDSLWGFVQRSDLIVIGRVVQSRRYEDQGHTPLPGAVRLRVEEVLAGSAGGGEIGILVEGVHQPTYALGERVLVFARREGNVLRSLQNRAEKVSLDGASATAVGAVRRYAAIARITDAAERCTALKRLTLELLGSPNPRLHQDAVFDLSRPGSLDPCLGPADLERLAALALDETSPLVVREGIAAKFGTLAREGRSGIGPRLARLAVEPKNPAVRVAALNALRRGSPPEAAGVLAAALDDENVWVRLAAVEGLRELGAPASVRALERARADRDRRVAFAAERALAKLSRTRGEGEGGRTRPPRPSPEE